MGVGGGLQQLVLETTTWATRTSTLTLSSQVAKLPMLAPLRGWRD